MAKKFALPLLFRRPATCHEYVDECGDLSNGVPDSKLAELRQLSEPNEAR